MDGRGIGEAVDAWFRFTKGLVVVVAGLAITLFLALVVGFPVAVHSAYQAGFEDGQESWMERAKGHDHSHPDTGEP